MFNLSAPKIAQPPPSPHDAYVTAVAENTRQEGRTILRLRALEQAVKFAGNGYSSSETLAVAEQFLAFLQGGDR